MLRLFRALSLCSTHLIALAAPVPKPPADWVTVRGKVVWPTKEPIPELKAIDISRSPDAPHALKAGPVLDDKLIVHTKSSGLKNVIVWLRPDNDDPKATFPPDRVHPDLAKPKSKTHTLEMDHCRYSARVLALRAGDKLEVVNKSPVPYNFRLESVDVNVAVLPRPGTDRWLSEPMDAQRVNLIFKDDVHWWMSGTLRVFDHPYYAITNEHGEFEMKDVPRGTWRIVYWHETGFHKGRDGRFGYAIEVNDEGKGGMRLKPVEYERP